MNTTPCFPTSLTPACRSLYANDRSASDAAFSSFDDHFPSASTEELPVTSTLRLLEVSCGLTHDEAERLLRDSEAASTKEPAPQSVPASVYQRIAPMAWSFLLTGCVAWLLIAFS